MRIIFIGMKGCGKSTLGTLLAEKLQMLFIDSDTEIEKVHQWNTGEDLSFREIFKKYGEAYFNALDTKILTNIMEEFGNTSFVLACAGRTPLQEENREILSRLGTIVFLNMEKTVLLKRILAHGIPAFFPYQDDPKKSLDELLAKRLPVYKKLANITVDVRELTPEELVNTVMRELRDYDKN